MLTDTHIHLNLPEFESDLSEVIAVSKSVCVHRWIVPAVSSAQFHDLQKLHQQYASLFYGIGLHPWFLKNESETAFRIIEDFILQKPSGLVAIGECGLDGAIEMPLAEQIKWLEPQLELAQRYKLPVILHHRKSHQELLSVVKNFQLSAGGVWHAFSGSRQQAEQFIELGFKLGIGCVITYERAQKTRKAVAHLPLSSLLLETDGPTMPLSGYQGQRNDPSQIPLVFEALCELRSESKETLQQAIEQNVNQLFKI